MFTTKTIVTSLFWKFMERCGTSCVQFVTSIVLARLLLPEDFGLIALVMVFITLANVFVQNGFSTSLIQKKNADNLDFSSVFYASLLLAGVIYAILFFTAPLVANFYNHPELTTIVRVLALTLFFGALNSIQEAYIARNMLFKKLFWRSLGALVPSAAIGIACALKGFGVWALVIQQLCDVFLMCVFMWFTVKWRPQLQFSFERVKGLLSFGWKLQVSALLDNGYTNLYNLIVGKMFSPADLGYYSRGEMFPLAIVANINTSIQSVLMPALSVAQDEPAAIKQMMRRAITTSSFVILPIMAGVAALAKPMVLILLGEKWLPCVPFIQIFCCSYAFWPVHTSNLSAINALGRSDIFLRLEVLKKLTGTCILVLFIYLFRSPIGVASTGFVTIITAGFINAYPNKKLLHYGYFEQIRDISPFLILAFLMGAIVYYFSTFDFHPVIQLVSLTILGAVFYLGVAKLLHFESLDYLTTVFKELVNGKQ
ncbi:lipopolysaccharide biosynthesis protein [Fibrobacter succinogenes]|uniref:lipopolysaccharide biosynthesis protein n=1 Tax=Fibrobacter succinogenes TaxID=833 RepID=UPI001569C0A1|nr:lipopolysaccharide biosynthesis protein [Fibrobacter succinogenes]